MKQVTIEKDRATYVGELDKNNNACGYGVVSIIGSHP